MNDQDTFQSETFGTLTFVATKSEKFVHTCQRCLLLNNIEECRRAKCVSFVRDDKKNGFFTKREMPKVQ